MKICLDANFVFNKVNLFFFPNNKDDGEISFEEFVSVVGGQFYRSHSEKELRQAFM